MVNPHIVKSFDLDLNTLTDSLGAMGDFAVALFRDAIKALIQGDRELALRVIEQDRQLDALRRDLSSTAANVIIRRQPMAHDLDEVLSDFRIVEDLERVGDLAKNIAKRATVIRIEEFPESVTQHLNNLAALATSQLLDALHAYATRDEALALRTREGDEKLDQLHTEVFKDLVAQMSSDPNHAVGYVHLLFCAKNIERIGDHATHIAEAAYLNATGKPPAFERKRVDYSSMLSDDVDSSDNLS